MPVGPEPLGFAYFAGMKFAGYSTYAAIVKRKETVARSDSSVPPSWRVGLVRTLIGLLAGVSFGLVFWMLPNRYPSFEPYEGVAFFGLLVPIRAFEWLLLWHIFYRRSELKAKFRTIFVLIGILVSLV